MRLSRTAVVSAVIATLLGTTSAACRKRVESGSGTAGLRGRVVSAHGRPLVEVKLTLARGAADEDQARPLHARTDASGAFSFANAAPGRYALKAEAVGFATSTIPVALIPLEVVTSVLRLDPLELLEGIVKDANGKPVTQALVFAWPIGAPRTSVVEARSGADGRFSLAGVSRGPWSLLAEAPGFATLRVERVDVPARDLVLALHGEARSLGGLVLDERGAPQAGARVVLGGAGLSTPREGRTDAKGLFMFHGIGFGRYVLRAAHGRFVSRAQPLSIDAETGWMPPARLTLRPGLMVRGRALDDRGAPIGQTTIEVTSLPPDEAPELARSDARGAFAVGPLPAGLYQLVGRAHGHAPALTPELRLSGGDATIDVRLPRAARLVGRLVDGTGRPAPGALVTVTAARALDELLVLPGVLPPAAEAANPAGDGPASPATAQSRSATTDGSGAFLIDELPPARYRLLIEAQDALPWRREIAPLAPGERRELGTLKLATGVPVWGRVQGADGEPLVGARIEARRATVGEGSDEVWSVTSDDTGGFTLRIPPGDVAFVARARGRVPALRAGVRVEPGRAVPALAFVLKPANALLEGLVRVVGGRPLPQAVVVAELPAADDGRGVVVGTGTTKRDGRFRLTGLPPEALVVEIRHPEWPTRRLPARPGQEITVDLPAPGGISGELRDAATGAAVTGARIVAKGPGVGDTAEMRVRGGSFECRTLAPGRWTFEVTADTYAPATKSLDVPSSTVRGRPSVTGVRLELRRLSAAAAAGAR